MISKKMTRVIGEMLRSGYGAEDIAVTTGLPVEDVRDRISRWREQDTLQTVLAKTLQDVLRNTKALLTMGILESWRRDFENGNV